MSSRLILASSSPFRAQILTAAGVKFTAIRASFDERTIEKQLRSIKAKDVAEFLAEAKAVDCAQNVNKDNGTDKTFILGCDQTLELEGKILHKAKTLTQARQRLEQMSQKTHYLHSAMALIVDGKKIWSTTETVNLTMRQLSATFIANYLKNTGEKILSSVGCYQIEGEGIQLFEKIEGDFFSIIGLPLLPLLKKLRELGVLDV